MFKWFGGDFWYMKDLKETILDFIDDNKEKTKFIKNFCFRKPKSISRIWWRCKSCRYKKTCWIVSKLMYLLGGKYEYWRINE